MSSSYGGGAIKALKEKMQAMKDEIDNLNDQLAAKNSECIEIRQKWEEVIALLLVQVLQQVM